MTHSRPRQIDSLRAVGCEDCVLKMFLIDIRLSRPEALRLLETIAMESAAGAASRPSIRACFLMGVLQGRTAERERNHVPVLFATKERKTEVRERKSEHGPLPA